MFALLWLLAFDHWYLVKSKDPCKKMQVAMVYEAKKGNGRFQSVKNTTDGSSLGGMTDWLLCSLYRDQSGKTLKENNRLGGSFVIWTQ